MSSSRTRFEAYCERDPTDGGPVQFDGAWRLWQAAEADALERCAKLCLSVAQEEYRRRGVVTGSYSIGAEFCAAAIRELKQ